MEMPVFFIGDFTGENILTLNEETSKHVVQVLRMKPTGKIQLTDGAGALLTAEIIDDHKKKCTVRITEKNFIARQERQVCVAMSLLKNASRFEWFLEKAIEIGVTEIIPMLCERTEKQHFRYERMSQIVISAMMQSKQVWLPALHNPTAFETVISSGDFTHKLIAHCGDESKDTVKKFSADRTVKVLIGPEGDFTQREIVQALQNNYQPVSLGNTRLRTETAGVVAATLLCV